MRKAFEPAKLSRRAFLGGSLATILCAGCSHPSVELDLPDWFTRELEALNQAQSAKAHKRMSPNERIGLAIIGMGTRGTHHLGCAGYPGVELRAVSDVDERRFADSGVANDSKIARYRDFR